MKNEITISDSKSLKIFLSNLIRKSVNEALEKTSPFDLKEQDELPDFLQGEDEEESKEETKPEPKEDAEEEVETETEVEEELPPREDFDASPKSLFRLINSVRSGKSIKRGEVRDELSSYFENLTEPEQTALIEFLTGLSDIIVRGETAEEAEDPGDEVKMTAKAEVEVQEDEKESTPEDTSPPIKVKGA
tara:strand:+ start:558 stop:1127 length:570 start_codon:yes stop_codon:yes gene_type:complete